MEPDDPQAAAIVKPGEPGQAGGAGLGLDPGTEIEITTVDSYDEEPRTYTTTLELLGKNLERDLEEYFRREVRSDLRWTLSCDTIEEVYSIRLDKNVLIVVLKKGEYTVKRYMPLKNLEYVEQEIVYVDGSKEFKVGSIRGVRLFRSIYHPPRLVRGDCYYALSARLDGIVKDIVGDLAGDTR
jgi:hypothetical protein